MQPAALSTPRLQKHGTAQRATTRAAAHTQESSLFFLACAFLLLFWIFTDTGDLNDASREGDVFQSARRGCLTRLLPACQRKFVGMGCPQMMGFFLSSSFLLPAYLC